MTKCASVVVPVYRRQLSESERLSLRRCVQVLSAHPIILCAPEGLDLDEYIHEYGAFTVQTFESKYFADIESYNRLMLSDFFYSRFEPHDYVLIYQLDAYAFSDRLEEFCALGHDYIGAPWKRPHSFARFRGAGRLRRVFKWLPLTWECEVGNGGFSLRRTQAMIAYLKKHARAARRWTMNEDIFWSMAGAKHPKEVRVAPLAVAGDFAFEAEPTRRLELNQDRLPFGCHAFDRYEPEVYRRLGIVPGSMR